MRKLGIFLTATILFVVLIAMLGSMGFFSTLFVDNAKKITLTTPQNPFTSTKTETETQEIERTDNLVIQSALGDIKIMGGKTDKFEITLEKQSRSNNPLKAQELLESISWQVEQSADTTTLILTVPKRSGSTNDQALGNFTLLVPQKTNLKLSTNLGNIEVSGIEGSLQAYSDLGTLKLTHFTGAAALETSLGNIEVTKATFPRELVSITKLGDLHIQGNLGETTVLESRLGNLNLLIPQEQSYVITGQVKLGDFNAQVPFSGHQAKGKIEGILGSGEQKGVLTVNLDLGTFKVQHLKERGEL